MIERMKNDNRLFTSADGEHITMIDEAECPQLVAAVSMWRNGQTGVPKRWAAESHICDSMSYGNWRVYPRIRNQTGGVGYRSIKRRQRRRQFKGM